MAAPNANRPGGDRAAAGEHELEDLAIVPQDAKRYATLAARLALRGFGLHRTADGVLLISRWSSTTEVPDLAAVERFLANVGGRP